MLREITVPSTLTDYLALEEGEPTAGNRLVGLSKLNVFVGPNNMGKSWLLRSLFDSNDLTAGTDSAESEQCRALIRNLTSAIRKYENVGVVESVMKEVRKLYPSLVTFQGRNLQPSRPNVQSLRSLVAGHNQLDKLLERELKQPFSITLRDLSKQPTADGINPTRIYIPALRGLRPVGGGDSYRERTIIDYFPAGKYGKVGLEDDRVFTGQTLTNQLKEYILGDPDSREKIAGFEGFLSATFFSGQDVVLMPKLNDEFLTIRIGSEEKPVYQLGDGIQQVIILTLPIFLHKSDQLLLFIEEPELFLHPGYQRIFTDTVLHESGLQHQVFMATHSSQFLDITIDESQCSVFRVTKVSASRFEVALSSPGDFSILQTLGVRNSSVFLSNCTVWVEGVTDRFYLRRYLQLYQEQEGRIGYQEDLHFSFVEYSGDNIDHWSFLSDEGIDPFRLCGHPFLVADLDDPGKKTERHDALRDVLGDDFYLLPCQEVENLLSVEVIKSVVRDYEGDEDLELNDFCEADYKHIRLGEFIESNVLKEDSNRHVRSKNGPYGVKNGTIKDKPVFCKKALQFVNEFSDLSESARDVAKKIYDFIHRHNS